MSDGYSDKSVSPLVYQPAADNDPQAKVDIETDTIGKMSLTLATVGTTIAPVVPWIARKIPVILPGGAAVARMLLVSATELIVVIAGPQTYSVNIVTGVATAIGTIANGTAIVYGIKKIGQNLFYLGRGGTSVVYIYRSVDNGLNWVQSHTITASPTNDVSISGNADGSVVVVVCTNSYGTAFSAAYSTDSGASFTNSAALALPGNGGSATGVVFISGTTWLATASNNTTKKIYSLKSIDNGANWELRSTSEVFSSVAGIVKLVYWGGNRLTIHNGESNDLGETWSELTATTGRCPVNLGANAGIITDGNSLYYTTNALATRSKFQPIGALVYAYSAYQAGEPVSDLIPIHFVSNTEGSFLFVVELARERFVTLPEFQVASPAKLSALLTATAQLVTAGKSGTVKLYLQHTNDAVTTASSLADVAGEWTDCGALQKEREDSLLIGVSGFNPRILFAYISLFLPIFVSGAYH